MQKDLCEKTLESYNDVFADIVNVLLFDGEQIVDEKDLVDSKTQSIYKVEKKIREQERDVAKHWKKGDIRICLYGLENQTKIDSWMPLRIIGYDGANYRQQISEHKAGEKMYPVVTLVLYFGQERWRNTNLHKCLEIPKKLLQYVNDYKVHVFEIAWLSPEQVSRFKSDFKIVADYFVQKRCNQMYVPGKDEIRHVDEILKTMAVLTGEQKYEQIQQFYENKDIKLRGGAGMGGIFTEWREAGFKDGLTQGEQSKAREVAKSLLKLNVLSVEQISTSTGLSVSEVETIKSEM